MKWLLIVAAVLGLMILAAFLIGTFVPKTHKATRAARFHQSPAIVWRTITDYEQFPQWRSNVTRVEPMPSGNGLPAHREWDKRGHVLPMETVELDPPRRCVGRIADPSLPFGGTWTMEIAEVEGGSKLRITEEGEIRSPLFRFAARFFIGYTATMETYLRDLGRKFGETLQLQP